MGHQPTHGCLLGRKGRFVLGALVALAFFGGCRQKPSSSAEELQGEIHLAGSTLLMPLVREAAEQFTRNHPQVSFAFLPSGSFAGKRLLVSGSADIACSDVDLGSQEAEDAYRETAFAWCPIHVIAHPSVGVGTLEETQVSEILSGKRTRWSEVGGADIAIVPVRRLSLSGTRFLVDSFFLPETPTSDPGLKAGSSDEVASLVETTPGAIGFSAAAAIAGKNLVTLALNGVMPSADSVRHRTYPLIFKGRLYYSGDAPVRVRAFVEWVAGNEFAGRIQAAGFVPMTEVSAAADTARAASPAAPPAANPWEIAAMALAGIGLFLAGMRMVSSSMKKMATRRLRVVLGRWTRFPALGALWGILSGAVTQSGTSVAFLLVGFVSSGMIPLAAAMRVVAWADVGSSLLVFLATANVRLVALYFLGLSSIAYSLDKHKKRDALLLACLGLGLLLFGFDLVKSTARDLTGLVWVQRLVEQAGDAILPLFVLGALLRLLTQSSSAVTILCIPLIQTGLLSLPQTCAMVCGTSAGAALAGLMLSTGLGGQPRQLIYFKCVLDAISGVALFLLLMLANPRGEPYLALWLMDAAPTASGRVAALFLALKLAPTLLAWVAGGPLGSLMAKLSPVTVGERMAGLLYLHEQSLEHPDSAVDCADRESRRILRRLPGYLDEIRRERDELEHVEMAASSPGRTAPRVTLLEMHSASRELDREITHILGELMSLDLGVGETERLLKMQNRHQTVMELAEAVHQFTLAIKESRRCEELGGMSFGMPEALHAILHTAVEYAETPTAEEGALLFKLTSDNGELMENMRNTYLKGERQISLEARPALLQLTTQFQRVVWLVNRWVRSNA